MRIRLGKTVSKDFLVQVFGLTDAEAQEEIENGWRLEITDETMKKFEDDLLTHLQS